jgi:transketolase
VRRELVDEGVSGEVSSIAGTQRLGNLIVIWDDNQISIEDDTSVAFTEDVVARYAAYGWHTQTVDWRGNGGPYDEDVDALHAALENAKATTDRPSFIALRTIIGWPAPNKQDTGAIHGAKLGADEVAATKRILGVDPDAQFLVDNEVREHALGVRDRGTKARQEWEERFATWQVADPDRATLLERLRERRLPDGWADVIPTFEPGKEVATRKASGDVLTTLVSVLPELWGGSADLAGSNNTTPNGEPSFFPPERSSKEFTGHWYGRVLHFGVREHAMGSVLNGIALHGLTLPYGGTFLVFSDYMRPAVRLAAIMQLPVTYVWTHDSIGLGEDGPTHQPVEHLAALRAIPGLDVVRPADANETAVAWRTILEHHTSGESRPAGLCLTRQNVPTFPRGSDGFADAEGVARGGYVLIDTPSGAEPDVILIGTGSEVQLAVAAREQLAGEGIQTRVVSMPCLEWFDVQDGGYREGVLPPHVRARVSVEAAVAQSWRNIIGDAGRSVSLEHFGASADYKTLFREFGITTEAVVAAAKESLSAAN